MSATVKIVGDTGDAVDAVKAVGTAAKDAAPPLKTVGEEAAKAADGVKTVGTAAKESATHLDRMRADMRRAGIEAVSFNALLQIGRATVQAIARATSEYVAGNAQARESVAALSGEFAEFRSNVGETVVRMGNATGVTRLLAGALGELNAVASVVFAADRANDARDTLNAITTGARQAADAARDASVSIGDMHSDQLSAESDRLGRQIDEQAMALSRLRQAEAGRVGSINDLVEGVAARRSIREAEAMLSDLQYQRQQISEAQRSLEDQAFLGTGPGLGLALSGPFAGGTSVDISGLSPASGGGGGGGAVAREITQVSDAVGILTEVQALGVSIAERYARALRNVRDANNEGVIASKEAALAEREALAAKQEAAAEEAKRANEASFLESQRRQADEAAESLERYRAVQGKIADATASAASSLVDTNEKASKAIIRATGKTLGAEGVSAIRRGVIMGFSGNPIGGALLAGAGGLAILAARGMGASVADSGSRGGSTTREITNNNVSQTIVFGRGTSQSDILAASRAVDEAARRGISSQRRAA